MKMSQNQKRPDSSMTVDSLEICPPSQDIYTEKLKVTQKNTSEKYPKTILMLSEPNKKTNKSNPKSKDVKNYLLLNKNPRKQKSYLEKFREKFSNIVSKETSDVKSTEAESGDTHRESVGDDTNVEQFFETECYNEVFYQALINGAEMRSSSVEEDTKTELTWTASGVTCSGGGGERAACSDATVADTSTTRRSAHHEHFPHRSKVSNSSSNCRFRRALLPNVSLEAVPVKEESTRRADRSRSSSRLGRVYAEASCRLGGLGPDLQAVRPRLERARSVQRYSDKVRLENKIKITRQSTSLSEAGAANTGDVNKINTPANKKIVPVKEKSVHSVRDNVKKTNETKNPKDVKIVHNFKERENLSKTIRKRENKQINKNLCKGDSVKEENCQKNWQFSNGFEPQRSGLGVLRALEQRHEALRAALSDVCSAPAPARLRAALIRRH